MEIILEKRDRVLLPFNGKGKILSIRNCIWASSARVKVFTNNAMYTFGEIHEFLLTQIEPDFESILKK